MTDQTEAVRPGDQPAPVPNSRPDAQARYIAALTKRREAGKAQYGTYLQPFNGRYPNRDLLDELMDAGVYWTQIEMEREALADMTELREIVGENLAAARFCMGCPSCEKQTDAVMAIITSLLTSVALDRHGRVSVDAADLRAYLQHSSVRESKYLPAADRLSAAVVAVS
jgi:hypothetical protein